jgi:conjugative relaxase-like TrwC/TraI family protein
MMSVSPAMGAGQAGGYFSREDYYLRGAKQGRNSRWCGEGASALGLDGEVSEPEFRALCRGEDPAGNRIVAPRLSRDRESGELVETRRAGNDCTFSAPKSVSIAYAAGVDGVKEAHDAAVLSVARQMERCYCHYRSPEGILDGEMVAAKFDHATSRNIDPQLHSHLFVVNAVRTPEGNWRANEPKAIYQDVKSLGLWYRQELAGELRGRGFEIEIQDRSRMYFELRGIDPRLVEHFSSRRAEIEKQVALWKEEGKFHGVAHGRLYEMAALGTRDPKREVTREEVAGIFARGFESCGSSAEEVGKALQRSRISASTLAGRDLSSDLAPARLVELSARELTQREAVVERAHLLDQAVRMSGGRHPLRELSEAIDGAPGIVRLGRDFRGREFYTTPEMLELEAGNLERVRALAGTAFPAGCPQGEIDAFRERLASEGIRPTAGQWRLFENEVAGKKGVALTVGDPGTAKTSTLGLIERFNEEVLKPLGRERHAIDIACTRKAARELSLATGKPSFTLEAFQNAYAASKFEQQREITAPSILGPSNYNKLILEGVPVMLRVDEASLLGAKQAGELLAIVEELRERGIPVKLHLLGDTKQMQAIQAGDFLRQLRELGESGELEYTHLTEILRQRDPGLLEIARGLNREDRSLAENAREALVALDRRGAVTEMADLKELRSAAVEHYLAESRKPSPVPERAAAGERQSVLMVAATNEQRRELNLEVRAARIAAGEIQEGRSFPVLAPAHRGITVEGYRPGDTVLFSGVRGEDGRMHSWGARLGTEGVVTGIDRERNLVRVGYCFKGKGGTRTVTRDFPAAEMEWKTVLYREEERRFSVGDRVVALKNDAGLDLQNGSFGTVRDLDAGGRLRVDLGDREVELDLTRYRHLDHAYAVTIHKSQGATVDHSIIFAAVRPEGERTGETEIEPPDDGRYGRASYNSLNVAVTRARFETRVFTNSVEGLARSVEEVDQKSSALRRIPGRAREVDPERTLRGMEAEEPARGLGPEIDKLERAVRGPGKEIGRLNLEQLRVPSIPAPAVEPQRQLPVPPVVHRDEPQHQLPVPPAHRELELTLPRRFGLGRRK